MRLTPSAILRIGPRRGCRRIGPALVVGRGMWPALVLATLAVGEPAGGQQVTGQEVRVAVDMAVTWLRQQQQADGTWPGGYGGGLTALATVAILNAGEPPEREYLQRAISAVRDIPLQATYTVSLKIQALVAANPLAYEADIRRAANWLVAAQQDNGMWTYGAEPGVTDFSNTQFALLGLHEAERAGVKIPTGVWRKAEDAWVRAQLRDGGWSYRPAAEARRGARSGAVSTGSMTAAGVASLYITGNSLAVHKAPRLADDGSPICCGQYSEHRAIARGLAWLGEKFSVRDNPGAGVWHYYYLYGLERAGILSGLRYIGVHDWYRAGAAQLVRLQHADGHWVERIAIADTAFALLFLAKGHRPVLFHKLKWSNDDRWNLTRNDLAHLVSFIGGRLGEPVGWDTTSLDAALEDWLSAPILYLNGDKFPEFDAAAVAKLRDYVQEGGTILAIASCEGVDFRQGFVRFAGQFVPEVPLARLPADHPVFRSLFEIDGRKIELQGLAVGCRTSVFFCPRDVACTWELGDETARGQEAFQLGANIAAYATGLEPLPDKLDVVRMVERTTRPAEPTPAPRGALHIAQLMHGGDWRPNPKAIPNLAEYLHTQMGVDVVPGREPLRATDPKLAEHPVVYMTGHYSFTMTPEEVAALRKHLQRGGFLLANACCGRAAFDTSFRELAAVLFPDRPLEPLPADHPIIVGQPGVPLDDVAYRPSTIAELPDLKGVQLEGINVEQRTAVVYSKFGIDCGLDGHACFACRGLAPESARKVAGNVMLYALSY